MSTELPKWLPRCRLLIKQFGYEMPEMEALVLEISPSGERAKVRWTDDDGEKGATTWIKISEYEIVEYLGRKR